MVQRFAIAAYISATSGGIAFFAAGDRTPAFAVPSGEQSAPPMTTMESPRTSASGRTASRTRRRGIPGRGPLRVVGSGLHGPGVVAADEIDRQRIGQLLVDVAHLNGDARAARVD